MEEVKTLCEHIATGSLELGPPFRQENDSAEALAGFFVVKFQPDGEEAYAGITNIVSKHRCNPDTPQDPNSCAPSHDLSVKDEKALFDIRHEKVLVFCCSPWSKLHVMFTHLGRTAEQLRGLSLRTLFRRLVRFRTCCMSEGVLAILRIRLMLLLTRGSCLRN